MLPIERLKDIMAQLRDPKTGCPWDVEQNFASIAPHTVEEAYEVMDAIEKNDMTGLREELGDLLLQVIFHSQMAAEQGIFTFDDVAETISNKLLARHPHVFGDDTIKTAADQEVAWERLKEKERAAKANGKTPGVLDDVALSLPALMRAVKLQKRAAKVGFDWPTLEQVFAKVDEEETELKEAIEQGDMDHAAEEMGDWLFSVCNVARKLKVNPEEALRACNQKFERRFRYVEEQLAKQGKTVNDASLEEMDVIWDEIRTREHVEKYVKPAKNA